MSTMYLLSTFYVIYTSASFLPANRVAVLYLGLFLNSWNLYTPLAFVLGCYTNFKEFYGLHIVFTYALVILGYYLLSSKLNLSSLSNLLSLLDKPTVFGTFIFSALALVFTIHQCSILV